MKRRKIFEEGKYLSFCGGEGKGGKQDPVSTMQKTG